MKRTKFDENRDQPVANREEYPKGYTPELMCSAHGCPNRWTVDSNDKGINRLCSAHAWADAERWPEITQQQQWDETDRARLRGDPKVQPISLTRAERLEIVERLRIAADRMRVLTTSESA